MKHSAIIIWSYCLASYCWVVGVSQAVGQMQQLFHRFFWNTRSLQEIYEGAVNSFEHSKAQ